MLIDSSNFDEIFRQEIFLIAKMLLIQAHRELSIDFPQGFLRNFLHWYCCLKEYDHNTLSTLGIFGKTEEAFGSLEMKENLFLYSKLVCQD